MSRTIGDVARELFGSGSYKLSQVYIEDKLNPGHPILLDSKKRGEYPVASLSAPMPVVENSLMRVGRHLWLVSYDGARLTSKQLTEPGS